MKITLLEPIGIKEEFLKELSNNVISKGHEFEYYLEKTTDNKELLNRSKDSDIIIIANNPLPEEVIRELLKLKMINVAFTGTDHVGLKACKEQGIIVSNASGYSDTSVSELVIGLVLSIYRKILLSDETTRKQGVSIGLRGNEISGKTVGIIGTGRIGINTAKLFKSFGAEILGYNRLEKKEAIEMGIKYVDIETLLKQSDIVSLHLPLTEETRHFMSKERLELMKPSAILINCARGPIVDNKALAEALNTDKIAGAGVDVFDMESPIPKDYPLLSAKNMVLTPHIAFDTNESMIRRAQIVFYNLEAYLDGSPKNVIKL